MKLNDLRLSVHRTDAVAKAIDMEDLPLHSACYMLRSDFGQNNRLDPPASKLSTPGSTTAQKTLPDGK